MHPGKQIASLLLALLLTPLYFAQQPTFEVATIRHTDGNPNEGSWSIPGSGKFTAHNLPLSQLIVLAYGIDKNQIANKPSWLDSDLFDVNAKPSGNIALTCEELKPLLQSLLKERFHLATHTEIKLMPGYALTVAKSGPKLQPTKGSQFPNFRLRVDNTELNGLNWSMAFLATNLQHPAGRPVVDKTGLTGSYDLKLDFAPDTATDSPLPSIFTAIQDTLGLKLESQKVPVEVLVIDGVNRNPTEN
ncbi:MAG: TIGR03435 family protein [Granulicella sp.]